MAPFNQVFMIRQEIISIPFNPLWLLTSQWFSEFLKPGKIRIKDLGCLKRPTLTAKLSSLCRCPAWFEMLWGANISSPAAQQLAWNLHTPKPSQLDPPPQWLRLLCPGRCVQQLELEAHQPLHLDMKQDVLLWCCIPNLRIIRNILLWVCFLRCAHTVFLEGRVPVVFPHVGAPAAAALCSVHRDKGRARTSTLWTPSAENPGEDPWLPAVHSVWSSGSSPILLWVHQLFHAFSSLLIFVLPVLVRGNSWGRNCKCSPFLVCEKLNGSLPWCHGHIWDIPGTNTVVLQCMFLLLPTTKRTLIDFCFGRVHTINLRSILCFTDVFLQQLCQTKLFQTQDFSYH